MVPPAFRKVRKSVLRAQLDYLVEQLPKMQDECVSEEETCYKPVNPVAEVIVVNVVPEAGPSECTIVVISVSILRNYCVETAIEEAEGFPSEFRPLIQHENQPAVIKEQYIDSTSSCALQPNVLLFLNVRV